MRVVIQKAGASKVEIEGLTEGKIDQGLVILLGITEGDGEKDIDYLVEKISNMRLFADGEKHFEKSLLETGQQALVISQFTLYASCKKGRRPDFNMAAKPDTARPLYEKFIDKLREKGIKVETGSFGAMMYVSLVNEGPITIILDSNEQ